MKTKLLPWLYGVISAVVAFIAVIYICLRTFKWEWPLSLFWAVLIALICFAFAYYRSYATGEIKRITAKYHLTEADLAQITGLGSQNFRIYQGQLQLLLANRYLPLVLKKLRRLEHDRDYAER